MSNIKVIAISDRLWRKNPDGSVTFKRLPNSAFCGPNRTFPCHDAAHTRLALIQSARLFRAGINKSETKRIHMNAVKRAKKFGIIHPSCDVCKWKELPAPWRVS